MPEMTLRVKTRAPYPPSEGKITLIAAEKPGGGYAVRLVFDIGLDEANPTTDRSRTDPLFLCDEAAEGFQRATEWIENQFEVTGYESVDT